MSANKYRIVTDNFAGYEVQCKRWWWPFWIQCGYTNTHRTIEAANFYAQEHAAGRLSRRKRQQVVGYL